MIICYGWIINPIVFLIWSTGKVLQADQLPLVPPALCGRWELTVLPGFAINFDPWFLAGKGFLPACFLPLLFLGLVMDIEKIF